MTKNLKSEENCVFCKIARGEIKSSFVYESDNFFVVNDLHPVSEGHCLIIPKKHYATILDMPSSLGTELVDITKKQSLRLIKEGKAEGLRITQNNFEAAGQAVHHFHLHIIPCKKGKKIGNV